VTLFELENPTGNLQPPRFNQQNLLEFQLFRPEITKDDSRVKGDPIYPYFKMMQLSRRVLAMEAERVDLAGLTDFYRQFGIVEAEQTPWVDLDDEVQVAARKTTRQLAHDIGYPEAYHGLMVARPGQQPYEVAQAFEGAHVPWLQAICYDKALLSANPGYDRERDAMVLEAYQALGAQLGGQALKQVERV